MTLAYPAVIHKNEDNTYSAVFPDLAQCEAQGETLDECLENAHEAAFNWLYIELTEFEGNLPPVSAADDIELAEGDFVRNFSMIMRLTDGWDE